MTGLGSIILWWMAMKKYCLQSTDKFLSEREAESVLQQLSFMDRERWKLVGRESSIVAQFTSPPPSQDEGEAVHSCNSHFPELADEASTNGEDLTLGRNV